MALSGQGWQDELQSFLPHALDCVDPNCLHPLCVNLKLTLRHIQHCKKLDQCTICQGMRSLAVNHSNSCRDYYCRVPFCMESKVTTQQQILMDELVKTSPDGDLQGQENNDLHVKETDEKYTNADITRNIVASPSTHMAETGKATTPDELTKVGGKQRAENVPTSGEDGVWTLASQPPPSSKITKIVPAFSIGKTIQPEWTEQPHLRVGSPKTSHPTAQKLRNHGAPSSEIKSQSIPSSNPIKDPPKTHCQPGTKRKLQSFISTNNMPFPASKVSRSASDVKGAEEDDCPEIEIIDSKSGGGLTFKVTGAAIKKDANIPHKRKLSLEELSKKTPSNHVASEQKRESPQPLRPVHSGKRRSVKKTPKPSSKPASFATKSPTKPATWNGTYDALGMNFQEEFQASNQIVDDSMDRYIDAVFPTPPPSPAFEMSFAEPVKTNDSFLKSVLLDTLFQLLGVVTQPKTKQQEAIFVDLLERTLRVMKTEIAKKQ